MPRSFTPRPSTLAGVVTLYSCRQVGCVAYIMIPSFVPQNIYIIHLLRPHALSPDGEPPARGGVARCALKTKLVPLLRGSDISLDKAVISQKAIVSRFLLLPKPGNTYF